MATTVRMPAEAAARLARRLGLPARTLLATALLAVVSSAVHAERWAVDAGVSTMLTWSSNADLGLDAGEREADTILSVRPRVTLRGDGARLKVSGSLAAEGVVYANDTQPKRVLPEVDLRGRLEAIERLFFIEANVRAARASQNLFGVGAADASSVNTITTGQASISPSIERAFSERTRVRLRSDNSWTRDLGDEDAQTASAAGYFGNHLFVLEQDPRPFGWRLEVSRAETRYREAADDALVTEIGRLSGDYALGERFTAGLRVGREHTLRAGIDEWDRLYGWQARWQPTERTLLSAFQEKRSFGSSWSLRFDHRTPRVAWNISSSRLLDTTPQSALNLPPTANVAGLLDAIFTTRFPDPVDRAREVADFMANYRVPGATLQPLSVFAQRLSVVTSNNAALTLIGTRSTLTLSAFGLRTEDVPDSGLAALGSPITNNVQYGASIAWSRRLSALLTFTTSVDWARISALEAVDRTSQQSLRAQLTRQIAPSTSGMLGVRARSVQSNVASEGREGAVFVGLDHRM